MGYGVSFDEALRARTDFGENACLFFSYLINSRLWSPS